MDVIDFDLQGHFGPQLTNFREIQLVCMITCQKNLQIYSEYDYL